MERPKLTGETADGVTLPVEDVAVYMEELADHQHVVAEQTPDGFDTYRFPEHKQLGSVAPPNY